MKMIIRLFMALHIFLYRMTKGKFGGQMGPNAILLLHSVGRKSGQARVSPLVYFRDGENYVVTASNGGGERHPGWYFNLKQQPATKIEVMDAVLPVTARIAAGEERSRLWTKLTANSPQFIDYEKKTSREIPLFVLEPVSGARDFG